MGRHRLPATRRTRRGGTAVRNGLLGAGAAVVLGTAAVTTGVVPVGSAFPYVGTGSADEERPAEAGPKPSPGGGALTPQGGLANLSGRSPSPESASGTRAAASPKPSAPASPSASAPSPAPASPTPSAPSPSPSAPASASAPAKPAPAPSTKAPEKPKAKPTPPVAPPVAPSVAPSKPVVAAPPVPTGHSAEEAAVLALVNQERAAAGCPAVRANPPLAALAGAFSKDMAQRSFFDHTDPDGDTPWARAAQAGISGLGGENIARGQGDAASVMKSWMNSPGHRANILNCEFRTLGVGMYDAQGGPWWTQNFGF
ncbi:CAP domain-containing protein [Streptomyces sp. NPDC012888]|uniref:CAP domain-containing protein n=1 Tax=Streptomyces sp. NPDC012888 TaxID=3364855 RepID=UPI0036A70D99